MRPRQLIIVAIALVAAIGCSLLIMSSRPRTSVAAAAPAPAPATVQVLVAKHDLPIGARLAEGDLAWQPWPAAAINPQFITDGHGVQAQPTTPVAVAAAQAGQVANAAAASVTGSPMESLYGVLVRSPIVASEPITNQKLIRGGDGGYMAVVMKHGMRAMAVPVNVNSGAGGFILPGDHVDLFQARNANLGAAGPPAFTVTNVVRDVRVLAIDQSVTPAKGSESLVGAVVTLEVSDNDAKVITLARAQGEVTMALRPFGDHSDAGGGAGAVRFIQGGLVSQVMVAP